MKNELTDQQIAAILKVLDEAIEQGPWDASNFLKVIGKNLREARDQFSNQSNVLEQVKSKIEMHLAKQLASQKSNKREIFVSLYSAHGTDLQSWERIIINLPKQMISRPIYDNEEDVKALIKTKENKMNEAYVSMYVGQHDVLLLSEDKTPVDKLGKPLLTLKDKSLCLDNINHFVHQSGIYYYDQGRLVKNEK